jgi:predicted DNA-binding protein (UPF0251 family)
LRKVLAPPAFKGYRPFGIAGRRNGYIELLFEEYEAIKLADYDLMNHIEAASVMGISRPTFARIYETARRKIATAFVESKEIRTIYGNALMDKNWFECGGCHARFTIPSTHAAGYCPVCRNEKITALGGN